MTFAMAEQDDGIINMPESWVYYGGQHEGARSMTPLPKRKVAAARRDRRRAHDFLTPSNLTVCSNCGEVRLPHTVCPNCGFYKGREVVKVNSDEKAA